MGAAWTTQSLAVGLVRSRPRTPFDVCSGVLVPASRLSLDTRAALSLLSVPALAPALGELELSAHCQRAIRRLALAHTSSLSFLQRKDSLRKAAFWSL